MGSFVSRGGVRIDVLNGGKILKNLKWRYGKIFFEKVEEEL